jgi:hypothetical protein
MSAEFVPFLPSAAHRTAANKPSPAAADFAPATFAVPRPPENHRHETKVELRRSGDRITHIDILCHCGEKIELACDY